jgi:adenylate cyclase
VATPARATRRGSLLIAAALALGLGALYLLAPALLDVAELGLYNQHFRLRGARPADDRIVIVAIDEPSLRALGRWPWPRAVLARLVEALDRAGAAVVALDILLSEPEVSGEQRAAADLARRLRAAPPAVERALRRLAEEADHDRRLAEAIRASGRVVLASHFELAAEAPRQPPPRAGTPLRSALIAFKHHDQRGLFPPPHATAVRLPIPVLLEAAHGLGHANMLSDPDGGTRWEALVVEHAGHYYPSLALETVRVAAGLEPTAVRLDFGLALEVGPLAVPIVARARALVDYAGPTGTFAHVPAADVLAGRVPPERLRDRIVFVGATAAGLFDLRVTPFSPVMPGVEKHANVAANLLDGRFLVRPVWVELVEAAGVVGFPLLLGWALPWLRPLASLGAALGLMGALLGAAHLAFRQGLWVPVVYPSLAIATTFVAVTVFRFFTEERQRRWTRRAFQQYVSPEVVERIIERPEALRFGGEVRTLTVLFADVRDFTGFTERHRPEEVVAMLREYLTRLTACVLAERGTLDKYIGDAIMALFGAPLPLPDHAERACRAALAMVEAAERLQARWAAEGKEPLRIGVGINTGEMVVGNLGSEQLFDYTVVGDAVNLGARLESLNKEYRTARSIIISESTWEAARHAVEARRLGEVPVKGKARPVAVYELLGLKGTAGSRTPGPAEAPTAGAR